MPCYLLFLEKYGIKTELIYIQVLYVVKCYYSQSIKFEDF